MNKFFKSTFVDGYDRDTSINKYDNSHVFNAENVRIISDDPLSNGAITSIRGTSIKSVVSGYPDIKIVGSCQIRDFVVLFTYNGSGGAIYKFVDYGSSTEEAGELTLIYANAALNFQDGKFIYAEGRYESDLVQKVYFTDGETFFRHLNIVPPDLVTYPLTNSVSFMDIVSNINFGSISAELISGGALKSGKVQYSYQLFSVTGSESVYSPASPLYSIADSIDSAKSSYHVKGIKQGEIVDKSAKVTLTLPADTTFNRLRLVALDYESENQTPGIRIVGEYDITNQTVLSVIDTGASIGALTLEEFRFITNNFYPKTLASKDNVLFAGNINELYFDISDADFDARAYRYKLDGAVYKAKLIDSPGTVSQAITEWVSTDPTPTIDPTHDCYNPFNDLSNDGNLTNAYNLRPDGQLGGAGANISYKFSTTQLPIDDGYLKTGLMYGTVVTYDKLTSELDSSEDLVDNFAKYIGYQRDETYRFGIVLYDLKGRPSFVKWIGDIRFPNNYELPFITKTGSTTYANHLGIEFTVNIPIGIASQVSGYQIVRCERSNSDKTIKDSGVTGCIASPFNYYHDNEIDGKSHPLMTMPSIYDCYNGKVMSKRFPTGASYSKHYSFLDDKYIDKKLWEFVSPDICFNKKTNISQGDFIEGVGYLNGYTESSVIDVHDTNLWVGEKVTGFTGFSKNATESIIKKDIDNSKMFSQTRPTESVFSLNNAVSYMNICGNLVYGNGEADSLFSERGSFTLLQYNTDFDLGSFNQTLNNSERRWLMSYIRNNRNLGIYNGVTYETRLTNNYYPASEFIPKDTTTKLVYGGDTYINMFVYLRSIYTDLIAERRSGQVLMMFPIESYINTQFRSDQLQEYTTWYLGTASGEPRYCISEKSSFGIERFNINYPSEIGDLYRYNSAYSVIDKSKVFLTRPQDLNTNKKFDTRIYASGIKISGEYSDSWLKFKFNEYKDVDSQFGALTKLLNVNNKLMFFQPDGVGVLSVNDRALVQSPTSYSMILGTGGLLERFDYLTFDSGASYQEDIVKSNKTFYYVDRDRKKINKYEGTDTPISMIKGVNSLLKLADFDKVRCGFDPNYLDVFFSIDNLTIIFNELTNNFTSVQSLNPDSFFSIGKNLYSIKDTVNTNPLSSDGIINVDYDNLGNYILVRDATGGNTIYKHNSGANGLLYDAATNYSIVDVIIHPEDNNICQFTALDLRMDITDQSGVEQYTDVKYNGYVVPKFSTIKTIKFSNSYMSKEFNVLYYDPTHILASNEIFIKKIANAWRIQIPIMTSVVPTNAAVGVTGSQARFVDTYLEAKLTFDNSGSNKWKLHDIITYYNPIKV